MVENNLKDQLKKEVTSASSEKRTQATQSNDDFFDSLFSDFSSTNASGKDASEPSSSTLGQVKNHIGTPPKTFEWSGTGTTVRTNKILLILANFILILPFILKHRAVPFLIVVAIVELVQIVGIIVKSKDDICATGYIPTIFFLNAIILIAAFIIPYVQPDFSLPEDIVFNADISVIVLALAGIGMFVIKGWVGDMGLGVFFLSVTYGIFGRGSLLEPELSSEARTILFATFICACGWSVACQFARVKAINTNKLNKWLGAIVVCLVLGMELIWQREIFERTWELGTWLNNVSFPVLAWWKTILISIVLLLFSACAFNFKDFSFTADSEIFYVLFFGILLVKIVNVNYFPFSWIVPLIYITFAFISLFTNKDRMMGFSFPTFYPILFTACLLLTWMLHADLHWNIAATVIGAVLINNTWSNQKSEKPVAKWVIILLVISLEGVAFCLSKRFSVSMLLMLGTEFLFALVALLVVSMRYKEEGGPDSGANIPICIILGLLTLLTVLPRGIKTSIEPDQDQEIPESVSVSVEARGKKNSIEDVQYIWTDNLISLGLGDGDAETGNLDGFSTPVTSNHLILQATSSKGIMKESHYWVPLWKADWFCLVQTPIEELMQPIINDDGDADLEAVEEPEPKIIPWQDRFLDFIKSNEYSKDTAASFLYINDDEEPELWIQESDNVGVLLYGNGIRGLAAIRFYSDSYYYIPRANIMVEDIVSENYDDNGNFVGYTVSENFYFCGKGIQPSSVGEYKTDPDWSGYYDLYWDYESVTLEEYDAAMDETFYSLGDVMMISDGELVPLGEIVDQLK